MKIECFIFLLVLLSQALSLKANNVLERADSLLLSDNNAEAFEVLSRVNQDGAWQDEEAALYSILMVQAQDRLDMFWDKHFLEIAGEYYDQHSEDSYHAGLVWYYKGVMQKQGGELSKALECLSVSLKLMNKCNNDRYVYLSNRLLGDVHMSMGNALWAVSFYDEALSVAKKIGRQVYISSTYVKLADCRLDMKEYSRSLSYADSALQYCPAKSYTRLASLETKLIVNYRIGNDLAIKALEDSVYSLMKYLPNSDPIWLNSKIARERIRQGRVDERTHQLIMSLNRSDNLMVKKEYHELSSMYYYALGQKVVAEHHEKIMMDVNDSILAKNRQQRFADGYAMDADNDNTAGDFTSMYVLVVLLGVGVLVVGIIRFARGIKRRLCRSAIECIGVEVNADIVESVSGVMPEDVEVSSAAFQEAQSESGVDIILTEEPQSPSRLRKTGYAVLDSLADWLEGKDFSHSKEGEVVDSILCEITSLMPNLVGALRKIGLCPKDIVVGCLLAANIKTKVVGVVFNANGETYVKNAVRHYEKAFSVKGKAQVVKCVRNCLG